MPLTCPYPNFSRTLSEAETAGSKTQNKMQAVSLANNANPINADALKSNVTRCDDSQAGSLAVACIILSQCVQLPQSTEVLFAVDMEYSPIWDPRWQSQPCLDTREQVT